MSLFSMHYPEPMSDDNERSPAGRAGRSLNADDSVGSPLASLGTFGATTRNLSSHSWPSAFAPGTPPEESDAPKKRNIESCSDHKELYAFAKRVRLRKSSRALRLSQKAKDSSVCGYTRWSKQRRTEPKSDFSESETAKETGKEKAVIDLSHDDSDDDSTVTSKDSTDSNVSVEKRTSSSTRHNVLLSPGDLKRMDSMEDNIGSVLDEKEEPADAVTETKSLGPPEDGKEQDGLKDSADANAVSNEEENAGSSISQSLLLLSECVKKTISPLYAPGGGTAKGQLSLLSPECSTKTSGLEDVSVEREEPTIDPTLCSHLYTPFSSSECASASFVSPEYSKMDGSEDKHAVLSFSFGHADSKNAATDRNGDEADHLAGNFEMPGYENHLTEGRNDGANDEQQEANANATTEDAPVSSKQHTVHEEDTVGQDNEDIVERDDEAVDDEVYEDEWNPYADECVDELGDSKFKSAIARCWRLLNENPMVWALVTGMIGYVVLDLLNQFFVLDESYDMYQTFDMASFGLIYGLLGYQFHKFLDLEIPFFTECAIVFKICLEKALWTPLLLQGLSRVQAFYPVSIPIWNPTSFYASFAQALNFLCIPTRHRILFTLVMLIGSLAGRLVVKKVCQIVVQMLE